MLTDDQLDQLYKVNIPTSHYAGLRGVWDDGYQTALSTLSGDASQTASTTLDIPADTPVITQP